MIQSLKSIEFTPNVVEEEEQKQVDLIKASLVKEFNRSSLRLDPPTKYKAFFLKSLIVATLAFLVIAGTVRLTDNAARSFVSHSLQDVEGVVRKASDNLRSDVKKDVLRVYNHLLHPDQLMPVQAFVSQNSRYFHQRALEDLGSGRVEDATRNINYALTLDPTNTEYQKILDQMKSKRM